MRDSIHQHRHDHDHTAAPGASPGHDHATAGHDHGSPGHEHGSPGHGPAAHDHGSPSHTPESRSHGEDAPGAHTHAAPGHDHAVPGHGHGYGDDHDHEHSLTDAEELALAQLMLEQDTLQLVTVGIDIGSSTSHLLFAKVFFQRQSHRLSNRFMVVDRQVIWRSPILLTPFRPDGGIDADALSDFVHRCYAEAGLTAADVDSGAVILTGEAIKRHNARAIDEIFADESGRFVCATAGHRLECILAAHGSGATELSRRRHGVGLHVDIGGGTTKLALIDDGEILEVAAFAAGGRLIAQDEHGRWTRVDESARLIADHLGLDASPETDAAKTAATGTREAGTDVPPESAGGASATADVGTAAGASSVGGGAADPEVRARITRRLARVVVDHITGTPADALGTALNPLLDLTEPLTRPVEPEYVTFSGGVAEYLSGSERDGYGDIARDLADAIRDEMRDRVGVPVVEAGDRIRATVIGASQFTVQLSGKTVDVGGRAALPVRNIPVVHLGRELPERIDPDAVAEAFRAAAKRQDVDPADPVALAFGWSGQVDYPRLSAVARALAAVAEPGTAATEPDGAAAAVPGADGAGNLLVVVADADIAHALGGILRDELGVRRTLIVLDGIELRDLDYVDLGGYIDPPGVVPLVIKSLLFSAPQTA
jgi:ethanolamine utilization protein EutA